MATFDDDEFLAELEAEEKRQIPNDKLQQVSAIAEEMTRLQETIAKVKEILTTKQKQFDKLQFGDLPDAMDSIGLEAFRLSDGTRIEVRPVLHVRCIPERMDEIDEYLQETGNTGILKRTISAIIPRGEPEQNYARVKQAIDEAGYESIDKKEIHHSTLEKWAREWTAQGEIVPDELFNVFQGRQAKIVKGK